MPPQPESANIKLVLPVGLRPPAAQFGIGHVPNDVARR